MDSLVITGNKDKIEALEMVNNLYDAYDGKPDMTEFVIRVFYCDGKPRSVTITFNGSNEFVCGGDVDA